MSILSTSFVSALGFMDRIAAFQRRAVNLRIARTKCVLGAGSVVYDARLLNNHNQDISTIRIGQNSHIKGDIMTFPGGRIEIGDYSYINTNAYVWSDTSIKIGNRVLIAHNVNIFDNMTHPLHPVERHRQIVHILQKGFPENYPLGGRPIVIEDDVWIACSCVVLRGVTIGQAAVVGAGSVVTKDVPAWTMVAGNPARVVREIPRTQR